MPETAARITDACGPTASTYAPIAASAARWPTERGKPEQQARPSAPSAIRTTFWPETASRW